MKFQASPPSYEVEWRILRVQIVELTGWSLEYIDNLNAQDVGDLLAYRDGLMKATKKNG